MSIYMCVDFDANVIYNISIYVFIDMLIYSSINLSICIIYVHDNVDVSAYEYVNVCADGYKNDNDSYYCICVCI